AVQREDDIPDERLRLLFVCAHPAIDPDVRTALMLQTVLGLDAARIGAAFLVPPATMGQRLVRAKAKIRDARLRFEVPEREELPGRLEAVLAAIYAAYGTGWDALPGADALRGLAPEAIYLGRLIVALMPAAAEAKGLLALMLHCEARSAARRDAIGTYVPLTAQDSARWDAAMIAEAEALLVEAAARSKFGRFQTEAAIQSLHATSALAGRAPPAAALVALYDLLVIQAPSLGADVARAAAHGAAHGPRAGLALLDGIERARVISYQPFWAVRAHLLELAGDRAAAAADYDRAIGLSADPAVRAWLIARRR
ncbi:RNA polymerase sigma factor, partial [Nostoc linckia]|uniref:RNA polymerase sigma factor n=1 Tax=Nostoc linckia TaxID=92942 RepID=UPI000BFF83C4